MEEKEGSDWKNRLSTYENVLHQLMETENPPAQLIQQLQVELPRYLSDVNPNCLKVALTICQRYFELSNKVTSSTKTSHSQYSINYSQIAKILIEKSFTTNKQTNSNIASDLLLQCLHHSSNSPLSSNYSPSSSNSNVVLDYIIDELNSKSPRIVRSMIFVLNSYILSFDTFSYNRTALNSEINKIIENLSHLLDNRDQNIRREANSAINIGKNLLNSNPKQSKNKRSISPSNDSGYQSSITRSAAGQRSHSKSPSNSKNFSTTYDDSNDYSKNVSQNRKKSLSPSSSINSPTSAPKTRSPVHRKKFSMQNASSLWSTWVSKSTLSLLKHSKWQSVISGFDSLRSQYNDEPVSPSACAFGLATVFINRTFTPKVMNRLMTEILFYIKEDTANLSEDTVASLLHFFVDKITDKRLEVYLFEVADIICELMSVSYVFSCLYPNLQAKNPMLPARLCCYFSHCLQNFTDGQLDVDELAERIKPLCNHSDPNVRKSALDCVSILVSIYGDSVLDSFKMELKPVQIASIKKAVSKCPSNLKQTGSSIKHRRSSQSPSSLRSSNISSKRTQSTTNVMNPLNKSNSLKRNGFVQQRKQRIFKQNSFVNDDYDENDEYFNENMNENIQLEEEDENYDDGSNHKNESFIPDNLLNLSMKTSNANESHKAFESIENILNRSFELRGPSSMLQSEFVPLFNSISVWLKIENKIDPRIALDISKILFKSFKLITPNDSTNISEVFLMDIFILLNYKEKEIRKTTLNVLNLLNSMILDFIPNIFIPIFPKVGPDGRKAAVLFLRSLKLKMNINDYLPFFVNCMMDRNEEFIEACSPLIRQFLKLQGALESVKEFINDFPSEKKELILDLLSSEKASPIYNSCFLQKPTQYKKEKREKKIDCFLPLKILNETEKIESLTDIIEHYGFRYFCIIDNNEDDNFTSTPNFSSTDLNDILLISGIFLKEAENNFDSISLTLDIVFLWWSQLSLLIQDPYGFKAIFTFMAKLLNILEENERKLDKFEVVVILPTILECVGRPLFSSKLSLNSSSNKRHQSLDEDLQNKEKDKIDNNAENKKIIEIEQKVFELTPLNVLLSILVQILGNTTSIYTVKADFNALTEVLPKVTEDSLTSHEKSVLNHDIVKTVTKIQNVLLKDSNKNPDLSKSTADFIEFLGKIGFIDQNFLVDQQQQHQDEEKFKQKQEERGNQSHCFVSQKITNLLKSPSVLVYNWIVDLSSQDNQITIQALKSISLQLKNDPTIFEPHLEALTLWLITSVHTYFSIDPPPSRLCKYIALCLLTLFNETSLKEVISQDFIHQLIYEILTHLSNGINESVLNQVLNALIIKLIDDCTMYSFIGLLSALNEFNNTEHYTEKWIRLGLKCFEACGVRICEVKNQDDIKESVLLVNKMLLKNGIDELQSSLIGTKIINVIKSYLKLVFEKFGNLVNTKEMRKKLGHDSIIMNLINDE